MRRLSELASQYEQQVLDLQLPCGGWGYSRQWAMEPTCLALLALRFRAKADWVRGLRFLEGCQNADGSWPGFEGDDEGSWATALAVITLIRAGGDWESVQRGCQWLLGTRGQESHWLAKWRYRLFDNKVRFDPNKYGWPWTVGAASWVVPTSYALIALRLAFGCCLTDSARQRLDLGTAMLLDRACPGGGWNAGNGVAFGVPLEPHADVTSLALISLLPHRNHPTVQVSLSKRWRSTPRARSTPSPSALGGSSGRSRSTATATAAGSTRSACAATGRSWSPTPPSGRTAGSTCSSATSSGSAASAPGVRRFELGADGLDSETTLLETRFGELDNMESIAVWQDPEGRTRVLLLSDDNFFMLQRTVFAEYVVTAD